MTDDNSPPVAPAAPPTRDVQASALLSIHGELLEMRRESKQHAARVDARLEKGDQRMTRIEQDLSINTELTRDFAAARAGARALRTAMVWVGSIAGGGVAVWQAIKAFMPGSGIGPTP